MRVQLRLLGELVLRRSGLAGVVTAVGGGAAAVALVVPWRVARAELELLGESQTRAVAAVPGWQVVPWGAVAGAAGIVALVLGALLAVDRHPGWTRPATVTAGGAATAAGVLALLSRPGLDTFADRGGALADLRAVADQLPVGVELTLSVRPGLGAVLAVVGGALTLVGTAAARELDTR